MAASRNCMDTCWRYGTVLLEHRVLFQPRLGVRPVDAREDSSVPLSRVDIVESESTELPRKKFIKYAAQICYVGGDDQADEFARQLTRQHEFYTIDTQKLKEWFKFMGQEEELERLVENEAEYEESWQSELDRLFENASFGDTKEFEYFNKRASADVAKMNQGVPENDGDTQQRIKAGVERYVLTSPVDPKQPTPHSRLTWIRESIFGDDPDESDKEGEGLKVEARIGGFDAMRNEFEELDDILYDGFHCDRSHQARSA